MTDSKRYGGFTLVELAVAVTLSSVVLAGAGIILVGTYKTQRIQEGIQKIQENGRMAIEILARDVRGAGYYGCSEVSGSQMDPGFTNHLNGSIDVMHPLKGFEHSTTSADRAWYPSDSADPGIPALAAGYDEFSDSFVVNFATVTGLVLVEPTGADTSITMDSTSGLSVGDFLYLSNCSGSDLFQISALDADKNQVSHSINDVVAPGNKTDKLETEYLPGDDVMRFVSARYYVKGDVNNIDSKGNPVPTLFRSPTNDDDDGVPLVPWVENMQVLYGEDTGGTKSADDFVNANEVLDWSRVRALRLAILLRSEEELGRMIDRSLNDEPWHVLDHEFPNDANPARRRMYASTFEIRNGY